MKLIAFFLSFIAILLLLNLSTCDFTDSYIQNSILTFSHSDQQFSIVSFYLKMPAYVKKATANRDQIKQIYKKYVFDPIWDEFASKGECAFLAKNIKNPITDLDELNTEIKVLSNSGVEEIVKDALIKVSNVLPGPNTTIYLQVIDPSYKKMIPGSALKVLEMGIHADTYGTGRILISIDPTSKNWKNMLPRIVAHEYHHSIWISRNFKTIHFSLLDCLILEGRAEGFAQLIYPHIDPPWPFFLSGRKEHLVWEKIKPDLDSKDEKLIMKMIIGDSDIPFLSLYSMGYCIMQDFLKNNSEVSILEWTDMKPEEILSKSKYDEKFN